MNFLSKTPKPPAESRWERALRKGDDPLFDKIPQLRGVMGNPYYLWLISDPGLRNAHFAHRACLLGLPLLAYALDDLASLAAFFIWWCCAWFFLFGSGLAKGRNTPWAPIRDLARTPYTHRELGQAFWGREVRYGDYYFRWKQGACWIMFYAGIAAVVGVVADDPPTLACASLMGWFLAVDFAARSRRADVILADMALIMRPITQLSIVKIVSILVLFLVLLATFFLAPWICFAWSSWISRATFAGPLLRDILSAAFGPAIGAVLGSWRARSASRNFDRNFDRVCGACAQALERAREGREGAPR